MQGFSQRSSTCKFRRTDAVIGGELQWVTEHPGCKTGELFWLNVDSVDLLVSHICLIPLGFCGNFGLSLRPPWRTLFVVETVTLNSDGRSWWYWHMQNKVCSFQELVIYQVWTVQSLTCSLSLDRRLVRGEGGQPDTFGSCHNFFAGIRAIFSAINLLIQ